MTKREEGYEIMAGALDCLSHFALAVIIFIAVLSIIRNTLNLGMDDSDKDGWHRSGLQIHTDYKTGTQYLSDGRGGLVRRE